MSHSRTLVRGLAALALLTATASSPSVQAFCGFFVSGADAALSNNASQVALLRKGSHTWLTMSNNYKGPPEDFAMVIPVPVVLKKENVKTLGCRVFTCSFCSTTGTGTTMAKSSGGPL